MLDSLLKNAKAALLAVSLLGTAGCTRPENPLPVISIHKSELEKTIAHYSTDLKKQSAAQFLAEETKRRVSQVFPPGTPEPVQHKIKAQERIDADSITGQELIENIDYAFKARAELPWTADLDEHTFTHYVLPYRNGTTPLDQFPKTGMHWRRAFQTEDGWKTLQQNYGIKTSWNELKERLNAFSQEYRTSPDSKKVIEKLIIFLNTELWATKEGIAYHPSNAQEKTLEQILQDKGGRCSDLTHFSVMMLRAFGLPATTVRIPAWGKYDDNHQVVAVTFGKQLITFDGMRPAPEKEQDYWYTMGPAPKVYVEEFGTWEGASKNVRDTREQHPWFINFYLGTRSCLDKTREYTKTTNITITGLTPNTLTYMAVLNNFCSDGLAAIALEKTTSTGNATFKDMGCSTGILYFTANKAIIAHEDGKVEALTGSLNEKEYTIEAKDKIQEVYEWTEGKFTKINTIKGTTKLHLKPDTAYALKDPSENVWTWQRPFVPRENGTIEKY